MVQRNCWMSHLWVSKSVSLVDRHTPTHLSSGPSLHTKEAIMLPPPSNQIPSPKRELKSSVRVPTTGGLGAKLGPAPVERSPTPARLLAETAAPAPSGGSHAQLPRTRVLWGGHWEKPTKFALAQDTEQCTREHQASNGKVTFLVPSV